MKNNDESLEKHFFSYASECSDYLLSNNHMNDLILAPLDTTNEEVLAYYISLLKALSLKLTETTIVYFFDDVRKHERGAFD